MRFTRLFPIVAALVMCFASSLFAQHTIVDKRTGVPYFLTADLPPSSPAVQEITINGQHLTGPISLEWPGATVDPYTNTIAVRDAVEKAVPNRGGLTQGNTTISGSLTVTGSCFLGSGGSTAVNAIGVLNVSKDAPAASTAITITKDVTVIQDAGGDVTITLPSTPPTGMSRVLHIKNASTTYNVTDGANITIAPGTHIDLTWYDGNWE